jgi:hypothetical protein
MASILTFVRRGGGVANAAACKAVSQGFESLPRLHIHDRSPDPDRLMPRLLCAWIDSATPIELWLRQLDGFNRNAG